MSRICKLILVCEGWRDSAFARGFLIAAGVDSRNIDPKTNPGGSGHDWVKNKFVQEAANLAKFAEGRGVLGFLDEDGQGASRKNEVADLLRERGLEGISAQNGRCLLLPTRNLETWLYWLTAQRHGLTSTVDEATDYKKAGPPEGSVRIASADCRPAGGYLHTVNHTRPPVGCPAMLSQALGELREFLNAVRR